MSARAVPTPAPTSGAPKAPAGPSGVARFAVAWRTGAVAAVVAVVVNLLVLGAGRLAGADMVVAPPGGGGAQAVGVVAVVGATVVGVGLGTLLLLALRRRGSGARSALAVAGLVLGVVSIAAPLASTGTTASRVTLAAMHVATGFAWFLVVRGGGGAR